MAKLSLVQGSTSKLIRVFVQNNSVTTGAGLTGLTSSSSGLTAYYCIEGAGSTVAITLSAGTLGTWSSGGFVAVDGTNMPGVYELGLPNLALASGKSVLVYLQGAANMAPVVAEIEITAVNNQDAVRYGLSSLPNGPTMVKKNQAFNSYMFPMFSSADHITPVNSATITSIRSIDGGASASTTNTASYIASSSGLYAINFSAADLNGGNIMFEFTAPGCDAKYISFMTQP